MSPGNGEDPARESEEGAPAGAGEPEAARAAGPIVVGVHRGQPRAVLEEAARLAVELGRPLLCGYVAEDSYLTEWDRADSVADESLHPTEVGAGEGDAVIELSAAITAALQETGEAPPSWTLRLLAGDAAKALGRLAAEVDARLIVVGTHRRGFSNTLENWLAGSVGARLTHDQGCPVVVVPVTAKDRATPTLA